ncbi:MAG TPA: flagella basal body P-ring formation protein FlgA [Halieaceae bacterium]|nr:flagella basal body P-ring formation protein FlgA [Halieaceae bacterium]
MIKWLVAITLIHVATYTTSSAAEQSHSELGGIAARALEEQARSKGLQTVHVEVFPLDQRVSLPECNEPVRILKDRNQSVLGRVTIGMRCETPEPWTIYLRGRVTSLVSIPVLNAPINRSELIVESDIVFQEMEIDADLQGVFIDPKQIVGKIAVRNLIAGKPLRQSDLKAPQLISRGQSVNITSRAGGLIVTMKGKALGNARAGDRLWVQNQSSNKRVEGEVTAEGEVLIR